MYAGDELDIPSTYANLIAVSAGIMLFGACMPSLYFAGMTLCFTTYWTSKFFFLKKYKVPTKFGVVQSVNVVNLLMWFSWIHMIFGLYMMGSPYTFKTA
jgi:hypothetical protein